MKRKLFTLLTVLIFGSAMLPVLADSTLVEPEPTVTTTQESWRLNESRNFHIRGLDMNAPADNAILDLQFVFYTEYFMKNTQFESMEFPYITAEDVNGDPIDNVYIYYFVLYSGGSDWIKKPEPINTSTPNASLSRDEIDAWANSKNNGDYPTRIYILISPDNVTNPTGGSVDATNITFHDDIILTQKLGSVEPYNATKGYEFLQWEVTWVLADDFANNGSAAYKSITGNVFSYPETSSVSVDYDYNGTLEAGDIIDVTFTIENLAHSPNYLTLDLNSIYLEPVENNPKLIWSENESGWQANIINDEQGWQIFNLNEPYTYTQKFRIKDNIDTRTLIANVGLSSGKFQGNLSNFEYDDEIEINVPLNTYTVSFDSQGGTDIDPMMDVEEGSTITAPTTPIYTDHTFDGWYKDLNFTTAWNFETDIVSEDITLYAKWNPVVYDYTVNYETNGGSEVSPETVEQGQTFTQPLNPSKLGYTFNGWYTDIELTDLYDFNTLASKDLTLYAKWNPVVYDYTVNYETNGGSEILPETVEQGQTFTQPLNPLKQGYTFNGWYTDIELTDLYDFNTLASKDLTLYAKWNENIVPVKNYTVTYSDGTKDASVFKNQVNTVPEGSLTPKFLGNLERTGYTFIGWSPATTDTVTKDITYIAQWKQIQEPSKPSTPQSPEQPEVPKLPATGVEDDIFGPMSIVTGIAFIGFAYSLKRKYKDNH